MGPTLFLRGPRGLTLTTAGQSFADSARDALDRLSAAADGVRLRRFRRLTVGAYGFFASRFLLPKWNALKTALPELEIDLHTSSNPLDLLVSRFDAVIAVSDARPRAGMVTTPLMPISTVPVCAPHLLNDGPINFSVVPLLHARPRPDDWRRWLDHAGIVDAPAQAGSSFESLGLAVEAAAAGLGVTIAIEGLLAPDLSSGALTNAHPTVRPTRRSFVLEYEQRMADDPAVAAFAAWLRDEGATLQAGEKTGSPASARRARRAIPGPTRRGP
jgi:LysR family glycine cleavage system transcriptional activator